MTVNNLAINNYATVFNFPKPSPISNPHIPPVSVYRIQALSLW